MGKDRLKGKFENNILSCLHLGKEVFLASLSQRENQTDVIDSLTCLFRAVLSDRLFDSVMLLESFNDIRLQRYARGEIDPNFQILKLKSTI